MIDDCNELVEYICNEIKKITDIAVKHKHEAPYVVELRKVIGKEYMF